MPNSGPFYAAGNYVGVIVSQGISNTQTGKPQLVFRIKITDTLDRDGTREACDAQYERTIYKVLTDNTIDYVREDLKRLGFTGTSVSAIDPSSPIHQSFVNQEVELYCKWEPDLKGFTRERWNFSRPLEGKAIPPLGAKELRDLDSMFGKHARAANGGTRAAPIKSAKPAAKVTVPQVQAVTSAEVTDDDVPF